MNYEPTPKEVLFLWRLIFMGEEPMQSALIPDIEKDGKERLLAAGLIQLEKRGRAKHVLPTDPAWDWAFDHLDAELPKRTWFAAAPLRTVLTQVKAILIANKVALADFVRAQVVPGELRQQVDPPVIEHEVMQSDTRALQRRVRAIYEAETGKSSGERLRLSRLRKRLPEVQREQLDTVLLDMQNAQLAVLYPIDDPRDLTSEDEQAAIRLLGSPRHIMYLQEARS